MTNREKYIDNASNEEFDVFEEHRKDFAKTMEAITRDKTADEMFEELGYKCISSQRLTWVTYQKESEDIDYEYDEIKINIINKLYYKEKIYKNEKEGVGISEAEDKAIHKKIEELGKIIKDK